MNYFTKLIDRFGNKPQITTVPPKTNEPAPANQDVPVQGATEQSRP
jgi:hypothetical protein